MGEASFVRAIDIHRSFAGKEILFAVSFQVRRGEVLGFLGPNGAGKTTTMQIVAGVIAPDTGRVEIAGVDLQTEPCKAKRQIGYLPEQPPLYRHLTVDEYLDYCTRLRRTPKHERSAAIEAAKSRCGLGEVGRRLIDNLSKGFQQRVGIAQAIVHRPAVLILDEPTAGLDPVQIREIRMLIRRLGEDHAVILSTHLLPEAQSVCDRVQIMHEGRLVLDHRLTGDVGVAARGCLRIGLRRPPEEAALAAIEGVARIAALPGDRFHIYHDGAANLAESVARAAGKGEWGLFEIVAERESLEEIFVSLTCGDIAKSADSEYRADSDSADWSDSADSTGDPGSPGSG